MYKLKTVTETNADLVVELGFVPDKIRVLNIDTQIEIEWNDQMDTGEFLKTIANGTRTKETSSLPITLIDGSDKTNNVSSSFGFVLGTYTGINDGTTDQLLIEAHREDGV